MSGTLPDPKLAGGTIPYTGAQQDVDKLLQYMVKCYLADHGGKVPEGGFHFKVASDGTVASRTCDLEVLSVALLDSENSLAASGTFTVAVARGKETYDLLKSAFAVPIASFNRLKRAKKLEVDGVTHDIDITLGGDYKFLLIERGLQSVKGSYPCFNCEFGNKQNLYSMTDSAKRSLKKAASHVSRHLYGQIHNPLFSAFEHCDIKPCELHLRLRIVDKLTDIMIHHAIEMDVVAGKATRSDCLRGPAVAELVRVINDECKVYFRVWPKKDKGKEIDFTPVMGPGKLKLMECLPNKLDNVFPPEFVAKYKELWGYWSKLYAQIQGKAKFIGTEPFRMMVSQFLNCFISLGAPGTTTSYITPYMHLLWKHIPEMMVEGLHKYTGQGVEGLNEVLRQIYSHKSNKWDPTWDCMMVSVRIHYLEMMGRRRIKRGYKVEDTAKHSFSHTKEGINAKKREREEELQNPKPKKPRGRPKKQIDK
eukprot:Lithocolla_globosa_v1_NODE_3046_length_1782_cov_2.736537.p1 type:complete len:478 gc:universal NODE_3046_length_1782_cov_2.736537:1552-119(-)